MRAEVAELADAPVSKSGPRKGVWVRVPPSALGKQRTRQHVLADLSVHYVEGFILEAGHTAQQLERDYGYDLLMFTYDGAS